MASLPRSLLRPARRALVRTAVAPRISSPRIARSMVTTGNAPPMEPQKARSHEMEVGELEGATVTIEPLRRVGEDEKTMRARLVYQSRKRGILETDLLLSTFADEYLPTMTREQMAEYDLFLDENDWDIYYWATQEEPVNPNPGLNPSNPKSPSTTTSKTTTDTSSAAYGSSEEATQAAEAAAQPDSTGGSPLTGEHADAKVEEASTTSSSSSPSSSSTTTTTTAGPGASPFAGEWAQTVGTFKPAYRPVPARWRNSATLRLIRDHVRARAGAKGGMAFMPALRS
ncbi:Flavinator of succinate dehydrogenase-domain-containing protein [Xylaria sp. CBS 124048]|nr:Flavinator of succinate dehydrogenase-domain-containing protein [Xylaria sp. CBS 124048]